MKEIQFIQNNKDRWEEFENVLSGEKQITSPDSLSALYIQITNDLAYAQTYYENSDTTLYLNQLSHQAHLKIYNSQTKNESHFIDFWKFEVPVIMYKYRKQLLYAFSVFVISCLLGIISTNIDLDFLRMVTSDMYVEKTIENIQSGDPMAIYKSQGQTEMFLGITINNIKVAILAFVVGLFGSFMTGIILMKNGVMLGSFVWFFVKYDLFVESTKVIWIHGTLEISAIIIAGTCGFIIGNSWMFPKTYSRKDALMNAMKDAVKLFMSLIPIFCVAGFLEAFVTRYTQMHLILSCTIICLSLSFVLWYYVLYPKKLNSIMKTKKIIDRI
ncbi:MAG: stage II sporulation protein M [Marinifilaceae bacterium]|jgi:uncharacterized membrane protein SpoIIM required for sporulation|nr:stage II sporulation protein M [Marinifilaceae bacterium]